MNWFGYYKDDDDDDKEDHHENINNKSSHGSGDLMSDGRSQNESKINFVFQDSNDEDDDEAAPDPELSVLPSSDDEEEEDDNARDSSANINANDRNEDPKSSDDDDDDNDDDEQNHDQPRNVAAAAADSASLTDADSAVPATISTSPRRSHQDRQMMQQQSYQPPSSPPPPRMMHNQSSSGRSHKNNNSGGNHYVRSSMIMNNPEEPTMSYTAHAGPPYRNPLLTCRRCFSELYCCQPWFHLTERCNQRELDIPESFAPFGTLAFLWKCFFCGTCVGTLTYEFLAAKHPEFVLAYVTDWASVTNTLYSIMSVINTIFAARTPQPPAETTGFRIRLTWVLFELAIHLGSAATLLFWKFLARPSSTEYIAYLPLADHGGLLILVLIDGFLVNRIPLRWMHYFGIILPIEALYGLWTYLHYLFQIGNPDVDDTDQNDDAIYPDVILWADGWQEPLVYIVIIVLGVGPVLFCLLWCVANGLLCGRDRRKYFDDPVLDGQDDRPTVDDVQEGTECTTRACVCACLCQDKHLPKIKQCYRCCCCPVVLIMRAYQQDQSLACGGKRKTYHQVDTSKFHDSCWRNEKAKSSHYCYMCFRTRCCVSALFPPPPLPRSWQHYILLFYYDVFSYYYYSSSSKWNYHRGKRLALLFCMCCAIRSASIGRPFVIVVCHHPHPYYSNL
jgi:hypothetical protein